MIETTENFHPDVLRRIRLFESTLQDGRLVLHFHAGILTKCETQMQFTVRRCGKCKRAHTATDKDWLVKNGSVLCYKCR